MIFSSPAVADNKVYVGSDGNSTSSAKLVCLNASNGDCIWYKESDLAIYASPAIANTKLFQSSQQGDLFCFCDNQAPEQPKRPNGPSRGRPKIEYEFNALRVPVLLWFRNDSHMAARRQVMIAIQYTRFKKLAGF